MHLMTYFCLRTFIWKYEPVPNAANINMWLIFYYPALSSRRDWRSKFTKGRFQNPFESKHSEKQHAYNLLIFNTVTYLISLYILNKRLNSKILTSAKRFITTPNQPYFKLRINKHSGPSIRIWTSDLWMKLFTHIYLKIWTTY